MVWSDGEEELKKAAGQHCSSFRAEMLALASGLENLLDHPDRGQDVTIVVCARAVDVHQLRAGHWSASHAYLRAPSVVPRLPGLWGATLPGILVPPLSGKTGHAAAAMPGPDAHKI